MGTFKGLEKEQKRGVWGREDDNRCKHGKESKGMSCRRTDKEIRENFFAMKVKKQVHWFAEGCMQ